MEIRKWTYELIIVVVLVVVGLGIWWFVSTKDERAAEVELETMIKFAQRQALEIAIIEQSSKLANYRQQMAKAQQAKTQQIAPNPPMPAPFVPAMPTPVIPPVADPVNIK